MRVSFGNADPDRRTYVVQHQRDLFQVQLAYEFFNQLSVAGQRVAKPRSRDAQTKTRIIKSNASKPVAQAFDDVAVLKRPERHAMQKEKHWTVALVNIVNLVSF